MSSETSETKHTWDQHNPPRTFERKSGESTCRFGKSCINSKCDKLHETTIPECEHTTTCSLFFTDKVHKFEYRHPLDEMICPHKSCTNILCKYIHPTGRLVKCTTPNQCYKFSHGFYENGYDGAFIRCPKLHYYRNNRFCRNGNRCRNMDCAFVHPEECINGYGCEYQYGKRMCEFVMSCSDKKCRYWHIKDDPDTLICCFRHYRPWKN